MKNNFGERVDYRGGPFAHYAPKSTPGKEYTIAVDTMEVVAESWSGYEGAPGRRDYNIHEYFDVPAGWDIDLEGIEVLRKAELAEKAEELEAGEIICPG